MPTQGADDTDNSPAPLGNAAAGPSVTLVVALDERRAQLRRTIEALAARARIDTAKSIFEALLRSSRNARADLLVLDLAMDGAAAPALIRHLARLTQTTDVLVFGDHHQSLPHEACDVWAWSEVDVAVQRWFDAWRQRGAAPP